MNKNRTIKTSVHLPVLSVLCMFSLNGVGQKLMDMPNNATLFPKSHSQIERMVSQAGNSEAVKSLKSRLQRNKASSTIQNRQKNNYETGILSRIPCSMSKPSDQRNVFKTSRRSSDDGVVIPPFVETFDSADVLKDWTIIDSNNDDIEWQYYEDSAGDKQMLMEYNTEQEMDDWLISPPVRLEANKLYSLSADLKALSASCPERIVISFGKAPTAEAMTNTIVDTTTVLNEEYEAYGSGITVKEAGNYYIGFHGISTLEGFYLYLDNVQISAPTSAAVPGKVSDLKVVPDANGELNATVSFTTPTTDLKGDPLTSLTKVDLYCNGELLKTFNYPGIGAPFSYVYKVQSDNDYIFKVISSNEEGESLPTASSDTHIGIYAPGNPPSATIKETAEGTVNISWEAPDKDVKGNRLSSHPLTYTVVSVDNTGEATPIEEGITQRTFDYKVFDPAGGKQEFVYYGVFARNRAGYSEEGTFTDMIPVGTPYSTPYKQSFVNGKLDGYILGTETLAGFGEWGVANDKKFTDVSSVDGDNGYIYMNGDKDDAARLYTGKITVSGTTPMLSFHYLPLGENDENVLSVSVKPVGEEVRTVASVVQKGEGVWRKVTAPMKDYIGKDIQLFIDGKIVSHAYIVADNFRISDLLTDNLSISSMKATGVITAGDIIILSAVIENNGTQPASGYSVNVYRDGKLFQTMAGLPELESDQTFTITAADTTSVTDEGQHSYSMALTYSADKETSDNATGEVMVKVLISNNFPRVAITGNYDKASGETTLTWPPVVIQESEPSDIIEDFENKDYPAFTYSDFGPWTLRNFNSESTFTINGYPFENQGDPFGFILFDAGTLSSKKGQELFAGTGGSNRSLMAFSHERGVNDAWLISPKLSGHAQTVKFRARALSTDYGKETFEVLYSPVGKATESFIPLPVAGYDTESGASTKWIEYSVDLPEAAKYFSIHSTADNAFALQIDSISYNGYPAFSDLALLGYNVYRDDKRMNEEPLKEPAFTDDTAPDGSHQYVVTAVYDQGESGMSNIFKNEYSAIDALSANSDISVSTIGKTISLKSENPHDVCVSAIDGRLIYKGRNKTMVNVSVQSGIYILTIDKQTMKVAVK